MSSIIGIGTDITECLRIARMIERHGEAFIDRIYTAEETRFCQTRKQSTQHFAGRWAGKEAVLKALGTGWRKGIAWRDIEILNEQGGKQICRLKGGAKDVAKHLGIAEILITLAHCHTHATAYALAIGREV